MKTDMKIDMRDLRRTRQVTYSINPAGADQLPWNLKPNTLDYQYINPQMHLSLPSPLASQVCFQIFSYFEL